MPLLTSQLPPLLLVFSFVVTLLLYSLVEVTIELLICDVIWEMDLARELTLQSPFSVDGVL